LATKDQKKIILNCDKALQLKSNEELLEKILGNIISNAIQYARTHVVIDVMQTESETQIRIQDDGPGIPETQLPHVFDRFYKGNNGNFGLGLAIAATATTLIGGKLTAENHSNGAAFVMVLNR
jgi:signal transduction histidine kinase